MAQAPQRPTAAFKEDHVETDGFRIRYMEAGQPRSVGTVVMLDTMTWGLSMLHHALAQECRVFAFELPGFGYSPANAESKSVKDLANTMAQAAGNLMSDKYTLIGTSIGANVALWQTVQAPDKVDALILISPTSILPVGGPATGTAEEMAERLLAHPDKVKGLPSVDSAIRSKEQAMVRRLSGATHDAEAESKLGEIKCATLVVFGLKDKMVAPEAARIYHEKIPNCNVSIVYDAGHLILAERPEALINAVSDYVERRETFIVGRQSSLINP